MKRLLGGLALLLAACAGQPPALPDHCLWLAPKASWCLADASGLPARTVVQQVEAQYGEHSERFIGQLEFHGDGRLTLAALSPLGQRLFLLQYDGRRLDYQPFAPLAGRFEPAYVLADLELAFWPVERLRPSLRAAGFELDEDQGVRRLSRDGALLASVRITPGAHWPARVVLDNPGRHYRLTLTTLEVSP